MFAAILCEFNTLNLSLDLNFVKKDYIIGILELFIPQEGSGPGSIQTEVIHMDDKKLRAMLAAVRTGSFSRAAEEIGYTQSGMTQMMNSLENELGCPLFVRSFNGVSLTQEGRQLLPYIADADAAMRRLQAEISHVAGGTRRPIRIGAFASIATHQLPAVIKAYRSKHPDIAIELRVGTDEILSWLDADAIDLALVDSSRRGAYRWLPLYEEELVAVVPGSSTLAGRARLSLQELAQHPFIMTPLNELRTQMDVQLREQIMIDSPDDSTLLSLVAQGLGVTVLPARAARGRGEQIQAIPLDPPLHWKLGAVLPKSVRGAVHDFVEFLCAQTD